MANNSQYNYSAAFLLGICQGPVVGANQIWVSKSTAESFDQVDLGFIYGTLAQPALGFLDTFLSRPGVGLFRVMLCRFARLCVGLIGGTAQFQFRNSWHIGGQRRALW